MQKQTTFIFNIGENLPYLDGSFDCVICCDILEHVRDLPKVISEILRVLTPNGVLFYDTLNRKFISKLVAIKIWQEWKRWAFMPPNLHVWKMFIKQAEMKQLLLENDFDWKEHEGSSPNVSIQRCWATWEKERKVNGPTQILVETSAWLAARIWIFFMQGMHLKNNNYIDTFIIACLNMHGDNFNQAINKALQYFCLHVLINNSKRLFTGCIAPNMWEFEENEFSPEPCLVHTVIWLRCRWL